MTKSKGDFMIERGTPQLLFQCLFHTVKAGDFVDTMNGQTNRTILIGAGASDEPADIPHCIGGKPSTLVGIEFSDGGE